MASPPTIVLVLAIFGLSIPCFARWSQLMHPAPDARGVFWARVWLTAAIVLVAIAAEVALNGFWGVEWFRVQPAGAYVGAVVLLGILWWLWAGDTVPPAALPEPLQEVAAPSLGNGRGGKGGSAKVGGSGVAVGGPGGRGGAPGAGAGGDGGSAEIAGDGIALGGEGGEAGRPDRAARGGRSPAEVHGIPNRQMPDGTWLWDYGRGGDGAIPQPARPHYGKNEIEIMLAAVRQMSDILDRDCGSASLAASDALQHWGRGILFQSGLVAGRGVLDQLRSKVGESWRRLFQITVDNQFYGDHLTPLIEDQRNANAEMKFALERIVKDIDELASAKDANFARFLEPGFESLRPHVAEYRDWVSRTQRALLAKTRELRDWHA